MYWPDIGRWIGSAQRLRRRTEAGVVTMKVLNLGCTQNHVFEGWFGSEGDFQDQLARGLLECPLCGDKQIQKRLSAPRLNLRARELDTSAPPAPTPTPTPENTPVAVSAPTTAMPDAVAQAAFLTALREAVARTEDVGERFANEARRMHYGEAESRSIRGRTSMAEAVELLEEGIALVPLPDLPGLKGPLQ